MRGLFRSHVEKNLTSKNVVILDTLNYIKGLRYELYCLARTAKSTNCVVDCASRGLLRDLHRASERMERQETRWKVQR